MKESFYSRCSPGPDDIGDSQTLQSLSVPDIPEDPPPLSQVGDRPGKAFSESSKWNSDGPASNCPTTVASRQRWRRVQRLDDGDRGGLEQQRQAEEEGGVEEAILWCKVIMTMMIHWW